MKLHKSTSHFCVNESFVQVKNTTAYEVKKGERDETKHVALESAFLSAQCDEMCEHAIQTDTLIILKHIMFKAIYFMY